MVKKINVSIPANKFMSTSGDKKIWDPNIFIRNYMTDKCVIIKCNY